MNGKIAIRRWRETDAAALAEIIGDGRVQDNLRDGLPYPYTERDAEEYIRSVNGADKTALFAFAVTADGVLAGSISAARQGNIHFRTAELGYYIAEPLWGRGIATEAIRLVCEYIFTNSDILRIFAQPFVYNAASCRALEKNGFVCEGILRANAVKNGRVLDMKMYSLPAIRSARCP